MRLPIAIAAVLLLLMGVATGPVPAAMSSSGLTVVAAAAQESAAPKAELDVNIHRSGGGWWVNPVWIAIGVIALVVLVLIVAMIARGGGTTIVKE
jgi:hypothetical protein